MERAAEVARRPRARTARLRLWPRPCRHRSLGQSMVEFAIVAPITFILVFGAIDFGRALYYENALTNAAREGLRLAVLADHQCNNAVASSTTTCPPSSPISNATSVCAGIAKEVSLVSSWGPCPDDGSTVPSTGTPNTAYMDTAYWNVPAGVTTSGGCDTTISSSYIKYTTPRPDGNKPIRVRIHYYFRPLTPIIGSFFPAGYYMETSACGRAEH